MKRVDGDAATSVVHGLWCGLVALHWLLMPGPAAAVDACPNVLFIVTDDMNGYGVRKEYAPVQTPHLDRLRSQAVNFTAAMCSAPVCNPSRASFLSGLLPSNNGCYLNGSDGWDKTNCVLFTTESLPECFKRNGYATFGRGKLFHSPLPATREMAMFENRPIFKGGFGPNATKPFLVDGQRLTDIEPWTGPDTDFPDVKNAEASIEFLRQDHDKPFFLFYGLWRPHSPYTAPKRFFDLYDAAKLPLPTGWREGDVADLPEFGRFFLDGLKKFEVNGRISEAVWREYLRGYCANYSFMDWSVGRVIEALDASPYASNTIVVVVSDNGFHCGEKQRWGKGTVWEESAYSPLLVRAPRTVAGECARPVSLVDLYPTLVDLCGLKPPAHALDGLSLAPLLANPAREWPHPALTLYGLRHAAVRTERYRFIQYPDGSEELYDRHTDPHEWTNVVSSAALAREREALRRHIPTNWAASLGGRYEQTLPPEVAAKNATLVPGWRPARQAEFRWSNPATNGPAWIRDAYILRVGDRYYMTGTKRISNTEDGPPRWPGFYLWSSVDLQKWREEGCLVSNEQVKWGDRSFWAPEIRWHPTRMKFYLCFNVRQSRPEEKLRMGMGLAVADQVTGPYTLLTPDAPITDNNDASLFFDDDGKDYVVQTGFNLAQIDLDTLQLVGEKRKVFAGGGPGDWDDVSKINEGSTLLKVNGTYYYFWSCNAWGYFVGYARATNIFGPYTKNPNNPVWGASKPEFRAAAKQPAELPVNEVGHGTPFFGPDGRLWISGHGHWIGGGRQFPYEAPRLWFDPLNFDPLTGEFTAAFSWTPQAIRYRAGGGAERRAARQPLGSVTDQLGSED